MSDLPSCPDSEAGAASALVDAAPAPHAAAPGSYNEIAVSCQGRIKGTRRRRGMLTIGVDFSKRTSVYSVWDASGKRLQRCKLDNEPGVMRQFFQGLPAEPIQLAMEATRNWGLYY